jgi:kynureninase
VRANARVLSGSRGTITYSEWDAELQSLLLRLSILLATSLSTLSEPLPPTIISDPSSSSSLDSTSSERLSAQILNDVKTLLSSIQKACTNLTLALKPSNKPKRDHNASPQNVDNAPNSGLDTASLDAAKAQVTVLTNDLVPKLTWLSRKASSEAVVYKYVAKTKEDLRKEKEEREFVKLKGGHIIQYPHSRETEKLEKIKGKGVGQAWSKQIVSVIVELHEALGELSEAFMSERTLSVLKKASEARAKKIHDTELDSTLSQKKLSEPASGVRQRALQATGVVWGVCDIALKGKLPKDNRAAVISSWKTRSELLKDALLELKEALLEDNRGDAEDDHSDDNDDPLAGLQDLTLSNAEKERAAKYEPLLRAGCQLYARVGEISLKAEEQEDAEVDYDALEEAGMSFSVAVDELVSSLLYAGELNDSDDGEDDEEETESEVRDALESYQDSIQQLMDAATSSKSDDSLLLLQSTIDTHVKALS